MRTIKFLLQKELLQIIRNKSLMTSMLVGPIIQLIILPLAANYTVKHILLAVVDHDHSTYSQKLVTKVLSSGYFILAGENTSYNQAMTLVELDKADLVLEIPAGFERNLVRTSEQKLLVAVNAINGMKAGLGGGYLGSIIADFNNEIRLQWIQPDRFRPVPTIDITPTNWYNPLMNYNNFFVPGILVMLVTGGGSFLTSLNIVREKEIGTIEQLNVTPIKKYQFILAKLIPFWILEIIVFTVGMGVALLIYGIEPLGHIWLLYLFLSVYMLAILGYGLLISTFAETQQQAMFVGFFFMMIFNLMSGLYTPIDSMPGWAKLITYLNPVSYFVQVMRMVVLKGSGFAEIQTHLLIIGIFAIAMNVWAVGNYKKTS
ncbi:MAG TPA: ABC transporter permease [Bacteroidota bacterium]|nr:ABC transporter permease [Bacteroidota bacterium]